MERYPLNAEGPFYVVNGECISCGVPEAEGDGLVLHDETSSHCYFVRQPMSAEETDSAIRATMSSCCGAIRYGGNDRDVVTRFAESGYSQLCDQKIPWTDPVDRYEARFQWRDTDPDASSISPRDILEVISAGLPEGKDYKRSSWTEDEDQASFLWHWALSVVGLEQCRIRITVRREGAGWWGVRVSENSDAALWTSVMLDKVLRKGASASSIRWISATDSPTDPTSGRPHPY